MAGEHIGDDLASVDDNGSSHHQISHAITWLHGLLERGAVGDAARGEDRDVSVSAFLQSALLSGRWRRTFEHLSRHKSHLPERIHERERSLFADVLS